MVRYRYIKVLKVMNDSKQIMNWIVSYHFLCALKGNIELMNLVF